MLAEPYLSSSTGSFECGPETKFQYRRYRENAIGYFKADDLSRLHWEYLLGQLSLFEEDPFSTWERDTGQRMPHKTSQNKTKAYEQALATIRTGLAAKLEVSDTSIELPILRTFCSEHLQYARIPSLYPEARIMKEVLPGARRC